MRLAYVVAYDICDPKRWRRVYSVMREFGDRIQYSVFRCELSRRERAELIAALDPLINHKEDQVLLMLLGPPGGKNDRATTALGRPYSDPDRGPIVV